MEFPNRSENGIIETSAIITENKSAEHVADHNRMWIAIGIR